MAKRYAGLVIVLLLRDKFKDEQVYAWRSFFLPGVFLRNTQVIR